jgi:glycosyltransferase involved in cell wall biosynthesis
MKPPKKKILFVVQLPPPVHGAAYMNQAIVTSELVNDSFDCRTLELRFVEDLREIGKFSVKKIWQMTVIFFRLLSILIRWRPQMVYYALAPTGAAFYRDAIYIALVKCFRVKITYHLHGVGIRQGAAASGLKRAVAKFILKNSYIVSLAKVLQSDIEGLHKGPAPFIQSNSIPDYDFPKAEPCTVPVFLFLSNLIRDKGIYTFLDSLNLLHKKKIIFKAFIVGAPMDVSIEEVKNILKDYDLTEKVEVTGPLFGAQKLQMISNIDVLVTPTKNDTYPLVILEAMQAGRAVIASNIGAISEMVDEGVTGYVIPSCEDAAAFAQKMEVLASDNALCVSMGERGKQKFRSRYTMKVYEENEVRILNQILN